MEGDYNTTSHVEKKNNHGDRPGTPLVRWHDQPITLWSVETTIVEAHNNKPYGGIGRESTQQSTISIVSPTNTGKSDRWSAIGTASTSLALLALLPPPCSHSGWWLNEGQLQLKVKTTITNPQPTSPAAIHHVEYVPHARMPPTSIVFRKNRPVYVSFRGQHQYCTLLPIQQQHAAVLFTLLNSQHGGEII